MTKEISELLGNQVFAVYKKYRWEAAVNNELDRAGIDREYALDWWVYSWLATICFAGFAYCLHCLIRFYYHYGGGLSHGWALTSLLLLGMFFRPVNMYDPASVFLFPLAFLALTKGLLWFYYPILIIATLNKETAVLLIPLFAIYHWRQMEKFSIVKHCLLQFVLYAIVIIYLRIAFADNPGVPLEWWFMRNISFLCTPSLFLLAWVSKVVIFGLLIGCHWRKKDPVLRHSFLALSIPLVCLTPFFGIISELRIFFEIYFLLCLLSLPTILMILDNNQLAEEDILS